MLRCLVPATYSVALLVSAWIEIIDPESICLRVMVALLVSAWIEILIASQIGNGILSRTPRECVD